MWTGTARSELAFVPNSCLRSVIASTLMQSNSRCFERTYSLKHYLLYIPETGHVYPHPVPPIHTLVESYRFIADRTTFERATLKLLGSPEALHQSLGLGALEASHTLHIIYCPMPVAIGVQLRLTVLGNLKRYTKENARIQERWRKR